MTNTVTAKPELLAPAGSIETFHAAINAGADAVYLGLNDFNARIRAKNFTTKTLSYLIPYAHDKNVKVYVTLNIQFKQNELEPLINIFYQLEQLGVDAIIIADPGAIQIARTNFPKLVLHGSTQMAIHNSAGVRMAEKLGLKRAVLARELSLDEIARIKKNSRIELETFIHGALCYCISGNCLASSILGGASGNRGRCTQVCRRKFTSESYSGYFFSPRDLCALDYLPFYISHTISCLKIEGRMKGTEYVHTVVKAYRNAIDNEIPVSEIRSSLQFDMGRPKTTLFLDNKITAKIIDPELPPGTGLFVGIVKNSTASSFSTDTTITIESGDRIRIQPQNGFEGVSVNVISIVKDNSETKVCIKEGVAISDGDGIYLINRKAENSKLETPTKVNSTPIQYKERCNRTIPILRKFLSNDISHDNRNVLWLKVDDPEWLDYLHSTPCQHLIFSGTYVQMEELLQTETRLKPWRSRLYPALPPFISESDLPRWKLLINAFKQKGINRWACTNIGQATLFSPDTELVADNPIWTLNSISQSTLLNSGFKWFTYSLEDDYLNIKTNPSSKGIVYLFSHVPLFISKIKPPIAPLNLTDPHGNNFFMAEKENLYYLLSGKPMGISQRKEKLISAGIHNFCFDLSFMKTDFEKMTQLLNSYKNGSKIPGSELYNFKAGLK